LRQGIAVDVVFITHATLYVLSSTCESAAIAASQMLLEYPLFNVFRQVERGLYPYLSPWSERKKAMKPLEEGNEALG